MLKLTDANYYSREANEAYMSASQFKSFSACEAAALAELRGEWSSKTTTALLVGSYVDAYFSGELEQFKASHPDLYKKDGTLKAEYEKAQAIAERLDRDKLAHMLLSGQHQTIKTGKIGGVWYKAKFDSLLDEDQVEAICEQFPEVRSLVPFGGGMIVDLKCMKDFATTWDEAAGERVSFVTRWGYDIQGAVYQRLDGRNAPFVIVGVTKESEPSIAAIYVPDAELEISMSEVEEWSPRYAAIKRGEIEPIGCGRCDYCRSTRKLTNIQHHLMID